MFFVRLFVLVFLWVVLTWLGVEATAVQNIQGTRIEVDMSGIPYLLGTDWKVYQGGSSGWTEIIPGSLALDISAANKGTSTQNHIYIINKTSGYPLPCVYSKTAGLMSNGTLVVKYVWSTLSQPGNPTFSAFKIDVDGNGNLWLLEMGTGNVYYRDPTTFSYKRPTALGYGQEITAGPLGQAVVLGFDNYPYFFSSALAPKYAQITGRQFQRVEIDSSSILWGIGMDTQLYTMPYPYTGTWSLVSGGCLATDVGAGGGNTFIIGLAPGLNPWKMGTGKCTNVMNGYSRRASPISESLVANSQTFLASHSHNPQPHTPHNKVLSSKTHNAKTSTKNKPNKNTTHKKKTHKKHQK